MEKVTKTKIGALVPDNRNFNKGTEFGEHLMDESLRKFGLGRSILVDRNNRIIAGNKTHAKAGELGFENVVVVETDGKTLVAVKRKDIDIDSPIGRELALADNATGKANLSFDTEMIMQAAQEFDFNPEDWGVSMNLPEAEGEKESENKETPAKLIVESKDLTKLSLLFSELQDRGFTCNLKES